MPVPATASRGLGRAGVHSSGGVPGGRDRSAGRSDLLAGSSKL